MSNDDGAGSVMLAFLVGAVAGAAAALLYAPATGRETRDFLGEKAREGRDRAAEAAAKGREAVARSRDTVATAIERGRDAYEQAKSGTPGRPAASSREGA
jgi:gas vesicle protein